jgi:transcriptional regulator with XRE-family HTH domain
MPTPDLHRVADAVRNRRGDLGVTQQDLAHLAGVSVGTIANLESAGRWPWVRNRTLVEAALGWQTGSLDRIGRGGEPAPVEQADGDRPRYLDPAEQHIADTPGLSREETEALIEVARAMRAANARRTGT